MSEYEEMLMCKTSIILGKDTTQMKLNDIIGELVKVIEDNNQKQWLRNWEMIVTPPRNKWTDNYRLYRFSKHSVD